METEKRSRELTRSFPRRRFEIARPRRGGARARAAVLIGAEEEERVGRSGAPVRAAGIRRREGGREGGRGKRDGLAPVLRRFEVEEEGDEPAEPAARSPRQVFLRYAPPIASSPGRTRTHE